MSRFTVAFVPLATALAAVPATASAALRKFRSPTGNLRCMFCFTVSVQPRRVF